VVLTTNLLYHNVYTSRKHIDVWKYLLLVLFLLIEGAPGVPFFELVMNLFYLLMYSQPKQKKTKKKTFGNSPSRCGNYFNYVDDLEQITKLSSPYRMCFGQHTYCYNLKFLVIARLFFQLLLVQLQFFATFFSLI
jgi:hypothetical protein